MNIVVVESPAKAKTINQYLGEKYKVLASYGHIRDLPNKKGSVLPEEDFAITYTVSADKSRQIKTINDSISNGDILWLATDADREGEAIAWHIQSVLDENKKLDGVEIKRVIFNEITKSAILDAFQNPKPIDLNMVNAYQARRALDYLMGFTLSPVLWKALPRSKSAGRVQSVALKLVCERETEIEAFTSKEYWTIEATFTNEKKESLTSQLNYIDGNKLDKFYIKNINQADIILSKIQNLDYSIKNIDKKRVKRFPSAPFITSTLQQEAYRKLGFSAKYTMSIAQSLYEGVEIQGETVGLISYMRTDSVNLSNSAVEDCKEIINDIYGNNYISKLQRKYKSKSKNAQEAHEAIRPTDPKKAPKNIENFLNDSQNKLYELIWKRTIASQMSNAEIDQVSISIESVGFAFGFISTGSNIIFDGFMKIYTESEDDKTVNNTEKNNILPNLLIKEKVNHDGSDKKQHFTQPPARYTEASLVKKLEELGIGRPSTYANIVSVIQDKGYVRYENKRFVPESKGRLVTSFLSGYFKTYIENNFTANLELQLDKISQGENEWKKVLKDWWLPYKEAVDSASSLRVKDVVEKIDSDLGPHFFPEKEDGTNPRKCPKCEKGQLKIQYGRFGGYIGCSNYPDCKFNTQLIVGEKDNTTSNDPVILGIHENGKNISLRKGPYGPYIQLGENEEEKKPKRITIPNNIDPNDIDLELAKKYLSLPRNIGSHPETGKMITGQIGRFGPYVKHEKISASISKSENIFEIGINRAVDLIVKKQEKSISKYRRFTKKKNK